MPVCYVANTASVAHETFDEETVLINLERVLAANLSTLTGIRPAVYVLGITLAVALVAALRALPLRQRRTARA